MIRISIVIILVGLAADMSCGQPVVVTPEETDEILANPGMGWQTFHRTRVQDKNLPFWIPSTVHYARWGWRVLEPHSGEVAYAFLDGVLKETCEADQTLAFRVMCCSTYPRQPYHPAWLTEIGGKVVTTRYGSGPELEVPVLDDCWDMRKWVDEGWSLRFIFNYSLALHGSFINNKSAPLPAGEDVQFEMERFLRRLGYRLVLKELSHPPAAQPGAKIQLAMKWQNVGSAPCYRPYRLAYRLSGGEDGERIFIGSVAVNKWLPGSIDLFTEEFFKQPDDLPPGEVHDVVDTLSLPEDLVPGSYTLSLAVVGEAVGEADIRPVVQLGIKGRSEDGWYPLSRLTVSR
jgi:hypothetical protein